MSPAVDLNGVPDEQPRTFNGIPVKITDRVEMSFEEACAIGDKLVVDIGSVGFDMAAPGLDYNSVRFVSLQHVSCPHCGQLHEVRYRPDGSNVHLERDIFCTYCRNVFTAPSLVETVGKHNAAHGVNIPIPARYDPSEINILLALVRLGLRAASDLGRPANIVEA